MLFIAYAFYGCDSQYLKNYSIEKYCYSKAVYGLYLFNTSDVNNSYFIEITDSTDIHISTGCSITGLYERIYNDDITRDDFSHGYMDKVCKVGRSRVDDIKRKMAKVKRYENPFLKKIYGNTWAGVLLTGNGHVVFVLSEHTNDELGRLVEKLLRTCRMPIDIRNSMSVQADSTRNCDHIASKETFVCKCFLFNTSSDSCNCLMEVMGDGTATAFTGTESVYLYDKICRNENITSIRNPFLGEVMMTDKRVLSPAELRELKCCISSNIKNLKYDNPFADSIFYNQWMAVLTIGKQQYVLKVDSVTHSGNDIIDRLLSYFHMKKECEENLPQF